MTKTQLEEIPGIGEKTGQKLLNHFGSVKKIKEATEVELISIVGKSATSKILAYFEDK